MSNDDLDGLFNGGGAPAFKFDAIGASVTGTITEATVRQQRDYATGEPKTYDDGNPMKEVVLTLATSLRDSSIEDDDGARRVFVRSAMLSALRDAVREAGARKPEIGGVVTVTYTGDGEPSRKGFNPPKQFNVSYQPPGEADLDATFVQQPAAGAADQAALLDAAKNLDPEAIQALLAGMKR